MVRPVPRISAPGRLRLGCHLAGREGDVVPGVGGEERPDHRGAEGRERKRPKKGLAPRALPAGARSARRPRPTSASSTPALASVKPSSMILPSFREAPGVDVGRTPASRMAIASRSCGWRSRFRRVQVVEGTPARAEKPREGHCHGRDGAVWMTGAAVQPGRGRTTARRRPRAGRRVLATGVGNIAASSPSASTAATVMLPASARPRAASPASP